MQIILLRALVASLHPWMQLFKVLVCLPVACSAGFGYILSSPALTPSLGLILCGVFLLACGAAGLNSLQEIATDSLFARTCNRPMVTNRIDKRQATWLSILLLILGLVALFWGAYGRQPLLLGITALLVYNGVYTPLKKITIFALFPGGLAGATPPLIGWTAAGGLLTDNRAWLLFSLFFLWQIPHFCLILLSHQKDYCAVDQPALIRLLPAESLQRITLIWILAFVVVALALALGHELLQSGSRLTIALMAVMLTAFSTPLLLRKKHPSYRLIYLVFNGAFFSTLLIVAVLQLLSAH
jgi:heme o synthase